ncbi:MAG: DUF3575 domain-containing protein [Aureispira sp.]|nr:DUF3575 domain-containing protein [Aureispira sp.]
MKTSYKMKHSLKYLLVLVVLLTINTAISAQQNVVKWGLDGLIKLRFDFEYERALTPKHTVALEVNAIIPRKIPLTYRAAFDLSTVGGSSYAISIDKSNWFVAAVLPQYRYYVTKMDAPNGFYVGAYLKGKWRKLTIEGNYHDDNGVNIDASIIGNVNTYGGGAQLGYQILIKKHFSIDFLLGVGLDHHRLDLSFISQDIDADYQTWEEKLNETLAPIPILGKRFKFDSGTDFLKAQFNFLFPDFRFGLSVGYAF